MIWLVLGIGLFLGIHSVRMVAPDFRDNMVERFGLNGWKGIYTLVSFAGLGLIIWGFMQARPDAAFIYEPPSILKHIAMGLMWVSFVALAASSFPAGQIKAKLKHPMITGLKIWAFAHLLANGDAASLVLFLSFLAWGVWNRIVVKRRGDPTPEAGPVINDIKALVAGTVLYVVFAFWAHNFLIGVPPIA